MTKEDSMLEAAMMMYGACVESEACEGLVVAMLMKEYSVSEEEATVIARLARVEWMEVYS